MTRALQKAEMPLTSSEMLASVNTLFPDQKIDKKSWSPQLSSAYRNPKFGIIQYEFPNNHSINRFFYGFESWGDNGRLRADYLEKLARKHKWPRNESLFQVA